MLSNNYDLFALTPDGLMSLTTCLPYQLLEGMLTCRLFPFELTAALRVDENPTRYVILCPGVQEEPMTLWDAEEFMTLARYQLGPLADNPHYKQATIAALI